MLLEGRITCYTAKHEANRCHDRNWDMSTTKRLGQFLSAFGGDWLAMMSGPPTVPLAFFAFYVTNQTLKILFASLAVACGFCASFRIWSKEREKVEEEVAKRGRPELTASFLTLASGEAFPAVLLVLRNGATAPAVGIHVDDIRCGSKVLRFFPPESIQPNTGHHIDCQILENGWGVKNNFAELFDAKNFMEHIQKGKMHTDTLRVRVVYQNLDSRLAQTTWVLTFDCRYDYTQHRIFSGSQSLDRLKP
jgi:hypothetical protein